jgi:threonine aldolase
MEGVQVEAPHTNIVFVDLTGAARESARPGCCPYLAGHGILATGLYRCVL